MEGAFLWHLDENSRVLEGGEMGNLYQNLLDKSSVIKNNMLIEEIFSIHHISVKMINLNFLSCSKRASYSRLHWLISISKNRSEVAQR